MDILCLLIRTRWKQDLSWSVDACKYYPVMICNINCLACPVDMRSSSGRIIFVIVTGISGKWNQDIGEIVREITIGLSEADVRTGRCRFRGTGHGGRPWIPWWESTLVECDSIIRGWWKGYFNRWGWWFQCNCTARRISGITWRHSDGVVIGSIGHRWKLYLGWWGLFRVSIDCNRPGFSVHELDLIADR